MVLKQNGLKDSIYFKRKRHVTSALKYIFLFLVFIKSMWAGPESFRAPPAVYQTSLFEDRAASEDGDVSPSVNVVGVLVVLYN